MKKLAILLVIVLIISTLSGCLYKPEKMKCIGITVYDSLGNELEGKYLDYYQEIARREQLAEAASGFMMFNSPAPVVNWLFVDGTVDDSYEIVFKFEALNSSYTMKSLLVGHYNYDDFQADIVADDVTVDGNIYTVKLKVDGVDKDHNKYEIYRYYDNDDQYLGFMGLGGRTYIRGVYFDFDEQE